VQVVMTVIITTEMEMVKEPGKTHLPARMTGKLKRSMVTILLVS